jgi:dipeptidyl-peptidase III
MNANNNPSRPCHYVHPSEVKGFRGCNHIIRFIVTAIHELLGHGTGKLLAETAGMYNFDGENLPTNPLTGKAIETWYQPGQTWTSVFEKLATSVEECRAMLVSHYLADNKEVLSMFGYSDTSTITADDRQYPWTEPALFHALLTQNGHLPHLSPCRSRRH